MAKSLSTQTFLKPSQIKQGQKIFLLHQKCHFFTADNWEKDTIFGAVRDIFYFVKRVEIYVLCSHKYLQNWPWLQFRFNFVENSYLQVKFVYSEKVTKFCEISTVDWSLLHRTNLRWRFRKNLWPSQNIWTLW